MTALSAVDANSQQHPCVKPSFPERHCRVMPPLVRQAATGLPGTVNSTVHSQRFAPQQSVCNVRVQPSVPAGFVDDVPLKVEGEQCCKAFSCPPVLLRHTSPQSWQGGLSVLTNTPGGSKQNESRMSRFSVCRQIYSCQILVSTSVGISVVPHGPHE
jgi:hypothetical protein